MSEKPKYVGAAAAAKQAALIKAYVDRKAKTDFVVNIIFDNTPTPTGIDGGVAQFNATCDKTFPEIKAAIDAGKNVFGKHAANIWPLERATDTAISFSGRANMAFFGDTGTGMCTFSILASGASSVTCTAGEFPAPALDDTDDGKSLVVNGHKWAMKKAVVDVDDAMSDTSENPVQNKVIKQYVDDKSGSSAKTFRVIFGFKDSTSGYTVENGFKVYAASCNITFRELKKHYAAGETLVAVCDDYAYDLLHYDEQGETFTFCGLQPPVVDPAWTRGAVYFIISSAGAHIKIAGGELPQPAKDGSDAGKIMRVVTDGWSFADPPLAETGANGYMSASDKEKLDGIQRGANRTTVDSEFSGTSENPVQNKAINTAIEAIKTSIITLTNSLKNKLDKSGGTVTGSLLVMKGLISDTYVQFGTTFPVKFYKTAEDCVKLGLAADDDGSAPGIRLKAGTPTEADDVATKSYVDSGGTGTGAVRYDAAQTLEYAQQAQARRNIDAAPQDTPNFTGYITLTPPNGDMGHGVGMTASVAGGGHQYALNISDVDEGEPTLLTGVKTPTDTDTNAAATVEYVKAKVASGGAGMDITGATVGQIAKITAVDASGVPTAWSPVDMPTGGGETWELLSDNTIDDDVGYIAMETPPCKRIRAYFEGHQVFSDGSETSTNFTSLTAEFAVDGNQGVRAFYLLNDISRFNSDVVSIIDFDVSTPPFASGAMNRIFPNGQNIGHAHYPVSNEIAITDVSAITKITINPKYKFVQGQGSIGRFASGGRLRIYGVRK